MGGPDTAPQAPHRSGRPGEAAPALVIRHISRASRPLTDGYLKVSRLTAAEHRRGDALADLVRSQRRLEIGRIRDACRAERDDDVADRKARRGGRAPRLHLDHDDSARLIDVELLLERLRQPDRLGTHTEIGPWNPSPAEQLVDDT